MHRLTIIPIILLASCEKRQTLDAIPSSQIPPVSPQVIDAAALKGAYSLCSQYGDLQGAAPLALQLTTVDPDNAGRWKEELAKIYFLSRRSESCLKVVEDLRRNHGGGEKPALLEMGALCHEALNHKEEALQAWRAVWQTSKSAAHAIRLAGTQFELGLLDDAEETITAGLASMDAKTVSISLPKTKDEMQSVPAASALHNLKALLTIKRDPSAKEAARAELSIALALSPDFELAKRNLNGLTASSDEPEAIPTMPPVTPDQQ